MSRKGQLLIAHPNLPYETPFFETVIYLYEDGPQGCVGVILNLESSFRLSDLFAEKGIYYDDKNRFLHHGGPVNDHAVVMLHSDEWYSSNTMDAGKGLCVSSDNTMLERLATGDEPAYWRLFAGMSAWSQKQLEMELSGQFPYTTENAWLTAEANDDIVFNYDHELQWQTAVELASSQLFEKYI